jgi:hypothetical protein
MTILDDKLDVIQDTDVSVGPTGSDVTVVTDFEVEVIQVSEQGPPGPPSASVRYGSGPPPDTLGIPGDFYIDTVSHYIYGPKSSTSWPPGVSLVGPQGAHGTSILYGPADPLSTDGNNGDFWINNTTHFLFGPKAGGLWPAGISLVGPQGIQGIQGIQGNTGPVPWTTPPTAWATATNYVKGPPASLVYTGGNTYVATVDHLSGASFSADLGAGKWAPVVSGGSGGSSVYISDTAPTGVPANSLWWNSTNGLLYVYYNDGDSTQWVIVNPVPDVNSMAVRYDLAQALNTPQQAQARTNIYAAPGNLLAFSGMQINGGFEVSQERAQGVGVPASGYVCDGWVASRAGTSAGFAFTGGPIFPGGSNSLCAYITTAQPALGATDLYMFYQPIEGYRVARLGWGSGAAQPITLAFWTAHHRTGLYGGVVKNLAGNRCYAFSYTQNVADVPQYNVVTIPGDTTGTWPKDNTMGMYVQFAMAAGSNYIAPSLNAWVAGNYCTGPGQVNAVAATTDYFRLGGVMVLPGSYAPAQEVAPSILRPFDQELTSCQRYWFSMLMTARIYATQSGSPYYWPFTYPVTMRAAPTLTLTLGSGSATNVSGTPTLSPLGVSAAAIGIVPVAVGDTYIYGQTLTGDVRF